MNTSLISISNAPSPNTGGMTIISNETINEDITFTFSNADGEATSMFDLPEAHINIFDSEYYVANNPDVAESVATEYAEARTSMTVMNANLPVLGISDFNQPITLTDPTGFNNSNTRTHSVALKDYIETGVAQRQNPSPLFDSEYYLQQNPDVAEALAGGSFNGDPLLHYVTSGATEGRDPNSYFDTDYYVAQNPGVVESGLNPLEHYVFLGSSQGADPSANFDPEFYLTQNPDVAAARIDPLTHFLTAGQAEGRSPMAG